MPKLKMTYKSKLYKSNSKYMQGKEYFEQLYKSGALPDCSRGFVKGNCGCTSYAKNIICGKEYCKDCGREGSPQHQKRFNRWLPKARALNKFGVLVVTIPEELRYKYQNKIRLSAFRTAIKNKLKRLGFEKGLMRWHLFGDCEWCKGKACYKCNHTGAGNEFKPHLNIIIESGFIKDINNSTILTELKSFVQDFWKAKFKKKYAININYHYSKQITDRVHQVKYITRSTFRIYDQQTDELLKSYRMTTVWGVWKKVVIEKEEALDNNECPECKKFIRWIKYDKLTNINTIIHLQHGKFKIVTGNLKSKTPEKSTRLRIETALRPPSTYEINFTRFAQP
jgi:hypothetical protein